MEGRNHKSLKDISWQVPEETYREDPSYSYSTLARFHREGFDNLEHLFDRTSSPSLTFGSMVDTLLTDGEEAFNQRFFAATYPEVGDAMMKVIQLLFGEFHQTHQELSSIPDAEVIGFASQCNYQNNWKPETRAKVIKEKGAEYYNMLLLAAGKEVVTSEDRQAAYDCVDLLRTSPRTKEYFQADNPFEDKERLYQLKFKGTYNGIPLRCMADLIIVDHKNKKIIPCDLKTSFKPEYRFYKSFVEWCYWIQAQLYWYIIRQNLDADDYFKDFELEDYRFIVICNRTRNPRVWNWPYTKYEEDLVLGNYTLKNWRNIVPELHHYLTSGATAPIGIVEGCNDISKWLEDGR